MNVVGVGSLRGTVEGKVRETATIAIPRGIEKIGRLEGIEVRTRLPA